MKKSIKMISAVLTAVFLFSLICISGAAAYDDNYVFSMTVKANKKLTVTADSYYRGATTNTTPWMVNYVVSDEGTPGTIMWYYLAKKNALGVAKEATDKKEVKYGYGAYYFHGEASVNQQTVFLGVRNNNDVSNVYHISGYWDEETAAHPFDD